jgi:hypothetical protein
MIIYTYKLIEIKFNNIFLWKLDFNCEVKN